MNRRMPNGTSGGVGEGSRKAPFYPIRTRPTGFEPVTHGLEGQAVANSEHQRELTPASYRIEW